jgi:hypothetical protein
MKTIYIMIMALAASCTMVFAEALPVVQLDNGANEISLTLTTDYYQDVKNVSVDVDPASLPGWLKVEKSLDVVDIKKGEKSDKQLVIRLLVDNPSPEISSIVMPFTLSDKQGHTWTFKTELQLHSQKPIETALYNNYPNPFNPSTTIRFSLKENSNTKVVIYNSLGQVVRTLVNGPLGAGMHAVQWNGVNEHGQKVASGVYFFSFSSYGFHQTKKMLMAE